MNPYKLLYHRLHIKREYMCIAGYITRIKTQSRYHKYLGKQISSCAENNTLSIA